mgnify:CR=1 FL=1
MQYNKDFFSSSFNTHSFVLLFCRDRRKVVMKKREEEEERDRYRNRWIDKDVDVEREKGDKERKRNQDTHTNHHQSVTQTPIHQFKMKQHNPGTQRYIHTIAPNTQIHAKTKQSEGAKRDHTYDNIT